MARYFIGNRRRLLLTAVVATLLLEPAATASAATTVHVTVQNTFFSPDTESIAPGDSVQWDWVNGGHTTTSDAGSDVAWNQPIDSGHTSYAQAFANPGKYTYHCNIHSQMQGTVIVGTAIEFDDAAYSVNESDGMATIAVDRLGDTSGSVSIDYATTTGGTATGGGVDYTDTSDTLTFADGETISSFQIPIINDSDPESDETVKLELSNPSPSNSVGVGRDTATLTIDDDDPVFQPDAMIRSSTTSTYIGNNVYSATASHEVKLVRVKKGKAAVFYARFQNDGTDPDVFKIHGGGTTRKFAVRYFSGTTDITRKVVAGTYRTNSVGPAGSRTIKVVVRPRSAAAVGDVRGVLIRATSVDDNVKKDAVIAKTKVVS